jgi:hypothetical protein
MKGLFLWANDLVKIIGAISALLVAVLGAYYQIKKDKKDPDEKMSFDKLLKHVENLRLMIVNSEEDLAKCVGERRNLRKALDHLLEINPDLQKELEKFSL